jgi:2-hydroxy-3-oxopropionate reductase
MGSNITLVGDVGAGQICKIANQIIVGLNIEAVSEALVFASRAGVDPSIVRQALMGGFASSKVLETHGQKMIDRKFEPGFRVDLHRKDLNLALQTARELGISLPNTSSTSQLFNSCAALPGGGDLDHSALVTVLERLSGHQLND